MLKVYSNFHYVFAQLFAASAKVIDIAYNRQKHRR